MKQFKMKTYVYRAIKIKGKEAIWSNDGENYTKWQHLILIVILANSDGDIAGCQVPRELLYVKCYIWPPL